MHDIDGAISERKMEENEFNHLMFAHLKTNPRGCANTKCIYCATWADHLRDEQKAWDCDPANQ